mgnify:CR=1 FL=1
MLLGNLFYLGLDFNWIIFQLSQILKLSRLVGVGLEVELSWLDALEVGLVRNVAIIIETNYFVLVRISCLCYFWVLGQTKVKCYGFLKKRKMLRVYHVEVGNFYFC